MLAKLTTFDGVTFWEGDLDLPAHVSILKRRLNSHRMRILNRQRRTLRIAQGLCGRCGLRSLHTTTRCEECAKLHNASNRTKGTT